MEDLGVYRERKCECGAKTLTVERHRFTWAESKADRCPHCIIEPGKITSMSYRWNRRLVGWTKRPNPGADKDGAVVRKRKCKGCSQTWTTWETRADGAPCKEVTVCHVCRTGARALLRRKG